LTEHPSAEELLDLVRGRIAPQRGGEVLRHLYEGCEKCLAAAPVGLAAGLGVERDLTAKEEAATESAIDRAFAAALREDRKLSRRQGQLEKTVKNVVAGGFGGPERLPRWMKPVDKIETLLGSSWSVRFENVALMVYFAQLAVSCAEQLETPRHGGKEVFDIRCRALAELGNAYRASDQFDKAGEAFARSRQLFELGTCPDSLEIRLLELEASFDAYSRNFGNACLRLKKVFSFYRRNGQDHFAGRTLLQLGRYTGFAGDFEKALRLIDESLSLLDVNKDAGLVYVAKQNQIEFLVWCKRYRDAEIELFIYEPCNALPAGASTSSGNTGWLGGSRPGKKGLRARKRRFAKSIKDGRSSAPAITPPWFPSTLRRSSWRKERLPRPPRSSRPPTRSSRRSTFSAKPWWSY
jgi:tetratricopeptide (TPR) repeat protein